MENIDNDIEVYFTDDNIQNVFETEANKVEISTEGIIITDEAEEITIENPLKIEILDIEFSGSGMDVVENSLEEYERTPRHDPPLERVDHTLVQVLTFPDRCSSNQPGS